MNQIYTKIKEAKKVLIISHVNPDGDTLGAMCALKLALGEKADMLVQTSKKVSSHEIYDFLPDIKSAKTLVNVEDIYDAVICVDVAARDRIVERAKKIFDKSPLTINFDHHKTNNGFAKYNLIDPAASSTCELLFTFFEENKIKITKDIADCLYVGILTDTGSFRYETTSPKTFEIVKKLVETGVSPSDIAKKCYDLKPKNMVLLQAHCVSNALFLRGDKIAYTVILNSDMEKFKASDEHTEGIAESLRSIKTVEISFVIKEAGKNCFKVSLRSKYRDIAKIAQIFGGGGHAFAAGCTIKMPKDDAIKALLGEIEKIL